MKTSEKVLIAALVFIIVMQFYQNSKINRVNDGLNNRIGQLQGEMRSMRGYVSSEVSGVMNRIKEENAVIRQVEWRYISIDGNSVNLGCEVVLNQIDQGSEPYLLYRIKGSSSWKKEKMANSGGLNFSARIGVSPSDIYEYQLYIDGARQVGGNIESIPVHLYTYTDFNAQMLGNYNHNENNSKSRRVVNLHMTSKTLAEPLRIKSADVLLYSQNRIADTLAMLSMEEFKIGVGSKHDDRQSNVVEEIKLSEPGGLLMAEIDFSKYDAVIDKISVNVKYMDGTERERVIYP